MHLLALSVDISDYRAFVGDTRLLLLDQAICDAFDLGPYRVKRIVMVFYPVFLLLNERSFKLIPTISRYQLEFHTESWALFLTSSFASIINS